MIVKIQRPLFSTEINPKALVYNSDRSFVREMPMAGLDTLFEDGSQKVYHRVELDGDNLLIHERVYDVNF